jgi:RNA-directed DNA polymerase
MTGTQSSENISTRLDKIANLAKRRPGQSLTTLHHHIDVQWLKEAYRRTRKDGAVGVDGQSADQYAQALDANLESLLKRAKTGTYRAPPVRRVHIPKGDGRQTRPLGIPTFEDKVLQRAVAMELEAVYEQDFLPCSYGFRPGRSAHQLLEDLREQLMRMRGGWVLEVDIKQFFDTLDHARLRDIIRQRIGDGVLLRLIGKWLKAGVMEEGAYQRMDAGTPQGGVISPLLANVFLHEVLDVWFEQVVQPRLRGQARLYRYADDFVIVFKQEADARRVMKVLPQRLGKYGLSIHPDKTRLIRFTRPDDHPDEPGSVDLLGFTLYWGESRRGNRVVKMKTNRKRLRRALKRATEWCKRNRHQPVRWQWKVLSRKLRGHYAYFGITGNIRSIAAYARELHRVWLKWLTRRSNHTRRSADYLAMLGRRYPLPPPRIVHSYVS